MRPQLSLDELRRFKWLLGGALALVSLWTVFFLDVEALGLVAVASVVIVAAMARPQWPARVPALLWRLAVPAIIAGVAADFYFSAETLPVLIRLAVLLVTYRAVAYRRKREDLQLIVLGLFLVVVAGVLTVSLEFALLLLVFTACALGFLFTVTMVDLVDTGPGVMRPEELREVPTWAKGDWATALRQLRRAIDWRVVGFASVLFVGVVGVSALLFMLIPRFEIGSSFFLDKYITRKSRTGFTEQVRFGDVTELVRDESVALRVDLTDAASLPELPYFRLIVLDEYTPTGFRMSAGLKNDLLRAQRFTQTLRERGAGHGPNLGSAGGQWTFYVEPGVSRFLPLPGKFATLRLRETTPVQMSMSNRLVALRSEPLTMTAFQLDGVELLSDVADAGFGRVWQAQRDGTLSATDPARHLLASTEIPAGVANETALQRMVAEISSGADLSAAEFVARATAWMQARHAYALSASIPRGEADDIVRWLESNEPAFCEYFASGLVVLCRAAGHPARVVAGFRGGALNAFENYIMVRNSDAHAWVEVFDGDGRWVRTDPTPGNAARGMRVLATAVARTGDRSWSARLDTLRVFWYRRVVNFDTRQQVELADSVKGYATLAGEALRARLGRWGEQLKAWLAGPWDLARAGRVATGGILLVALGWALARIARLAWRRWQGWLAPGALDPVRREAGRWLRHRQDYAREGNAALWPDPLVLDLQRLRYGRRETWPNPRAIFQQAKRVRRPKCRVTITGR
ncbi:MAG: transglutaminaseTgpA domain-containing protein [Candidatus Didemnitutus sp.]|nr:transglutaminaseTgpA domain-containing protein [Candidatus Didemnitutus sp.]